MSDAIERTMLFRELEKRCQAGDTDCLDPRYLVARVANCLDDMGCILDRTCTNFEDYTLHDASHGLRVVRLMDRLLGTKVAELNVVEIALLLMAAYGHDLGMAVGREDRERLKEGKDYREFLLRNESSWREAQRAREAGDFERCVFLESRLFQDFLRSRHHILSAEVIERDFVEKLKFDERSLAKPLARLCESHGLSIADLQGLDDYPFAGHFLIDMQFLACVLRLADYVELDAARAPQSLFDLIKPGSEISRREWRKSQASNFFVDERSIRFSAEFHDFFEEKALRDTLKGIENERRECMDLLVRRAESKHRLALEQPIDDSQITSRGYRYEEFRFQLEYREIIELLMGSQLYRDERVAIRELLQNALDACRHAQAASIAQGRSDFQGRIRVLRRIGDGGEQTIEVSDNGTGMTRSIVRDFFMRVGRSYYQSFAFRRRKLDFSPVSQFGIGILSAFMLAERIEVETKADPLSFPENEGDDLAAMKLDIRGPHEFFVVRDHEQTRPGTTVRLHLKKPLMESLAAIVERYVGRIPYTVEVVDGTEPPVEIPSLGFDFRDERFSSIFVSSPEAYGYRSHDLVFPGRFGSDLHGRIRFFLLDSRHHVHLKLHDVGPFSRVGFSLIGETLVTAKSLGEEARQQIGNRLASLRGVIRQMPESCRRDLDGITHGIEQLLENLGYRHGDRDLQTRWDAVTKQLEALQQVPAFRVSPIGTLVARSVTDMLGELQSFVNGRMTLAQPQGILTQDGLNVGKMLDLPTELRLGIGFLFNLDLCGPHRFSLNAARDGIIRDDAFHSMIHMLQAHCGEFLWHWFEEEGVIGEEIDEFLAAAPRPLVEAFESARS